MARSSTVEVRVKVVLDSRTQTHLEGALASIRGIIEQFGDPVKSPTLGRIVHYRGREGVQAMRAAIVSCTLNELDNQNVIDGNISDLDDEMHVHLHVITPGARGHFEEFNVPHGEPQSDGKIPPGTWCWPQLV